MISVIVPVYNAEQYVRQCIDSILHQTYDDLDIILIDDGSTDKSGLICDQYSKCDHRIRVFHTENKGLSAARNLGLREAKGEYVGFVDSDDWIESNMYSILFRQINETSADISACGVYREYMNGRQEYQIRNEVYSGKKEIIHGLLNSTTSAWDKLYKKVCWNGLLFPEGHVYEDISTIYKVILGTNRLSFSPYPLYHYRAREKGITQNRSIENLMDYWDASYNRFVYLSTLSEVKDDPLFCRINGQMAIAVDRVWRLAYAFPKGQKKDVFVHMVSDYVKKNYTLFGNKEWKMYVRASVFMAHFENEISLFILFFLNTIYRFFANRNKIFFP